MILDRTEIRDGLFGLVGFYNATNPEYPNLTPSLLESRSGRKVNEAHSLITIENIDQSIKNFSDYVYPDYSAATDSAGGYTKGSKVAEAGVNYEYINAVASSGNAPPNATYWTEIDELSDYLNKIMYASIDSMTDDWINSKKLRSVIKSIYDQILLYNGIANYRDFVTNQDNFVGLRIRMKKGERSLATIINKIGHQFDASFSGLTVYLYHSSQQDALATFTIDHTTAKSSQWTTLSADNILRYISDDYDAGGDFYIGYNQSDLEALGGQALKMDINWSDLPCGKCDSTWASWVKQYSRFIDVIGFEVSETEMPGGKLFDPDVISISATNNYGLNLNISTKCDISYFILQEEELFAEALTLGAGKKLMEALAYSTRGGNQISNQVKVEAKKELFHSTGVWGTLFDRYDSSIKSLSFDLSGLGEDCFPCNEASSILGNVTLS